MDQYLHDEWGPRRVRSDMDVAGRFAKEHKIRLVCNEFGVIRANVDVASRYRWIADVRSALEANEIGWTLWDYTDIFGITTQSAQPNRVGSRNIESPAIQALGLNARVHSP
jgi:endoglucanase